jgi:site-specific recombinase XerD
MTNQVTVLDPQTSLVTVAPTVTTDILDLFRQGYESQATYELLQAWYRMRDAWLQSKSRSAHTQRAYLGAWNDFFTVLKIQPWLVDHGHVRTWQNNMDERALSAATIGQRMSAVSSFYSFVIREKRLVDGIERSLFVDAIGRPRENPFRVGNIGRPEIKRYGKSRPLGRDAVSAMLGTINCECLTGKRDHALLLTFLLTGWRSTEVLSMKWGDIQPNPQAKDQFIFAWKGKGGKEQWDAFPGPCYSAIVAYLTAAGRWLPGHPKHIQPHEYVWLPLSLHGCANLKGGAPAAAGQPISGHQANNILRKRLRAAGVENASAFHIHSLRHTFAASLHRVKDKDILVVSQKLHHSSIAVTQIYLDTVSAQMPVDDYSQQMRIDLGI